MGTGLACRALRSAAPCTAFPAAASSLSAANGLSAVRSCFTGGGYELACQGRSSSLFFSVVEFVTSARDGQKRSFPRV